MPQLSSNFFVEACELHFRVRTLGMETGTLHQVLKKGYLDEQFYQLEDLQDDVSPNFVEEVVTLFFKDSSRLLSNIEQAIEKNSPDFQKLDSLMHQFKGSTSSIGALRVKNECTLLREYCNKENLDGCLRTFQKVKREHAILKQKLEAYFQLLRQIGPAEGASRPVI